MTHEINIILYCTDCRKIFSTESDEDGQICPNCNKNTKVVDQETLLFLLKDWKTQQIFDETRKQQKIAINLLKTWVHKKTQRLDSDLEVSFSLVGLLKQFGIETEERIAKIIKEK